MEKKIFMMLSIAVILVLSGYSSADHLSHSNTIKPDEKKSEVGDAVTVTVILERFYLDGEVSEELIEETIWSMEDFWAQYEDWQLVYQDEEQLVFQQHVDDISPLLKTNGYFGIDEEGVLSIFNGKPDQSNKIIQSFFQIDVEKLESRQHELLKKGIKVGSKDEYMNVLETFKTYTSSP